MEADVYHLRVQPCGRNRVYNIALLDRLDLGIKIYYVRKPVMIKSTLIFSIAVLSALCPFSYSYGADSSPNLQDCTYNVSGMTCPSCSLTLKTAVKKIKAVQNVKVEYDDKKAIVSYPKGSVESSEVISKIKDLGYEATLIECKQHS